MIELQDILKEHLEVYYGKQLKLPLCKTMTNTFTESKRLSTEELLIRILGRKPSVCKSCGFDGLVRTGLAPHMTT